MFELTTLSVDPKKAEEGTFIPYYMGSELLIAKYRNKQAEEMRMQKSLEHADVLTGEDEAEASELWFKIENEIIANTILLGWKELKINGQITKYTPELGIRLLSDPKMSEFREDVIRMSLNRQNFRDAADAEAVETVKETAAS